MKLLYEDVNKEIVPLEARQSGNDNISLKYIDPKCLEYAPYKFENISSSLSLI